MSGSEKAHSGLTRRNFLKATGAAGLAAAAGGALALKANDANAVSDESEEQIFRGACRANCTGGCYFNVHVREGKIVRTSARDMPNTEYNRICVRGLTHLHRVYSKERVKYPMKRVGERGHKESFERISWDEAFSEIAEKWQAITDKYGAGAMAIGFGSGNHGVSCGCRNNEIWNRFENVLGTSVIDRSIDMAGQTLAEVSMGALGGGFGGQCEPLLWAKAKTVVLLSANVAVSSPQEMNMVFRAQDAGAKIVCIDPIYTTTASKADLWVPVKMGTDGALAITMIKYIIDQGKVDEQFLLTYTNAANLVKEGTNSLLKQSDLGVKIDDPMDDKPLVMDASGRVGTIDEIDAPVLEGSTEAAGVKVTTGYSLFKEACQPYTLEYGSEITTVPVEMIKELADNFASNGPVNIFQLQGIDHNVNAQQAYRAFNWLLMLTGNFGQPGNGMNQASCSILSGNPALGKPEGCQGMFGKLSTLVMPEVVEKGSINGQPWVVKGVLYTSTNTLTNGAEHDKIANWLDKMELVVTVDMNFNESALWSDYILPCAHWFEATDIHAYYFANPYIRWNDKAIDPLFEAKSDFDIACGLAEALGYGDYFQYTEESFIEEWLDYDAAKSRGVTIDRLREEGAVRVVGTDEEPDMQSGGDHAFFMPLKLYYNDPKPIGYDYGYEYDRNHEAVPYWEPPREVRDDTELRQKYPFAMYTKHTRFLVHSQWWDVAPLVELAGGEPKLEINPEDAKEYGLSTGDIVRIFNDRGSVEMPLIMNAGLPRKVLQAPRGWDKSQQRNGTFNSLSSMYFHPACVNSNFNDVVVDIEKI